MICNIMGDISQSKSISYYQEHQTIIDKYKKDNNIRNDATAIQKIIEDYPKLKYVNIKRDAVIFILYPIIFCIFSLYCTISINKIIDLSFKNEYIFVPELSLLQGVFSAIGFISVGLLAMCFIFFFHNMYNRGIYGD